MDTSKEQTSIKSPIIILITGGSCSGKTSLSHYLANNLSSKALILQLDNYFIDYSIYSQEELESINFDIPEAFRWDALITNVKDICNGQPTKLPIYDFQYKRTGQLIDYSDCPEYIVIEGIMTLENQQLLEMADVKIFVDAPMDIMLWRRISRDGVERYFDVRSTLLRYKNFVRNSYLDYIVPHKETADIVIDGTRQYDKSLIQQIQSLQKLK